MQAIAPVIAVLVGESAVFEVATYATRESWPVLAGLGLDANLLNADAFEANPESCIGSLFDVHDPSLILSGSSPSRKSPPETPEQFAILEARRRGLPSLTVLDYWGMYAERFSRDGSTLDARLLPDRLCVLDRRALVDLAAFGVPYGLMTATHNPWLDRLVTQASVAEQARASRGLKVLLASQPLAEMRQVRNWPYDQFGLFEHLLAAMPKAEDWQCEVTLQILPHPSEDVTKWESVLDCNSRRDVRIELCHGRNWGLLKEADYLVTSHSTLAYEALYFGTPCISLRPAVGQVMRLWIEDAGLSHVFQDSESLRLYLASRNPEAERQRILRLKRELSAARLFFSDGQATKRVMNEVTGLLGLASTTFHNGEHESNRTADIK
jgi:hypothetical protein